MDALILGEVVKNIQGTLIQGKAACRITGVSIDSRKVKPGDLFFAFPGEHFDGHDFVVSAFEAGAVGAVISHPVIGVPAEMPLVMVSDPLDALQELGRYYRSLFAIPVIGVTGSIGKTTTKDLVSGVLSQRFRVLKSEGNYNNEIGLPLTLMRLNRSHQVAVLEMAMRGKGEIAALCKLSSPVVGVITNIGKAHLELLGSQEAIAEAKGELLDALPPEGCAVLNAGDPWQQRLAQRVQCDVVFYGTKGESAIKAREITLHGLQGVDFVLETPAGEVFCSLPLPGRHNIDNALAAAAVGYRFGLSLQEIASGLESAALTGMRLEVKEGIMGSRIIDDTYNANPASTVAALEFLATADSGRKIAVLGDMYELGAESLSGHRQVGEKAAELKIDCLCAIGKLAREIAAGAALAGMSQGQIHVFDHKGEAISFLRSFLKKGDLVLVKGSRGMQMEEITASLLQDGGHR